MNIDKTKTIAFTGHRKLKPGITKQELTEKLDTAITDAYHQGYKAFITGMADGFDLLAGEAVLRVKETFLDLELNCVIPFRGQEACFSPEDKLRYFGLLSRSSSTYYLSDEYCDGSFLHRNDYMLERCSKVIAYFDGSVKCGTGYTVRRAQRGNLPVINLY